MSLDLPSCVPLPDDVRHRALDVVLAGIDAPAPRWRRDLVTAAVAAVLVIGISAVATLSLARPAPEFLAPAAPSFTAPAPLSTPPAEPAPVEPLDSCRAAVPDPEGAGYPPAAQWRESEALSMGTDGTGGTDSVLIIDDRFACHLGVRTVTVSPLQGAPIGTAGLVRLAPAVVAVLNPEGESVTVSGAADARDFGDPGVIIVETEAAFGEDYRITVGDSYDGPPPPDLPAGTPFVERDLPVRAYDEADPQIMNAEACLATAEPSANSEPELWIPAFEVDTNRAGESGNPPVLVLVIGDLHAAFCVLAPEGPRLKVGFPLQEPTRSGGWIAYETAAEAPGGGSDGARDSVLVAVPPGTERVEVRGDGQEGSGAADAPCTLLDGTLAFCQLAVAPGFVPEVYAFDASGEGRLIQ